ncbi:hypothetical protein EVB91_106 [Rhizobium phage RHph_I1_18]|nr:hypothetical protein EVB91_106 [Rhizobium phage RHph_I1_18]
MFTVQLTLGTARVVLPYKEACKYLKTYRRVFPTDKILAQRVK